MMISTASSTCQQQLTNHLKNVINSNKDNDDLLNKYIHKALQLREHIYKNEIEKVSDIVVIIPEKLLALLLGYKSLSTLKRKMINPKLFNLCDVEILSQLLELDRDKIIAIFNNQS